MTREEAAALLGVKPPTKKMMIVTGSGNTIVRDFPADKVPGRWLREGVELKDGDVVPQQTSPGRSMFNIARNATAGTMQDAAAYAPMAIPGAGPAAAATRIGAGFALGAGADAGARALRGQEQSLSGSMVAGGLNAAGQVVGEALPAVARASARPLAKSALGNSLPGMEDRLLAAKTPVSTEGMAMDQKFIDDSVNKAKAAIQSSTKQFSAAQIRRSLRIQRANAGKNDLLSKAHESALSDALSVLQGKVGGGTTVTPSSLVGANGQPLPPTVARVPVKRLTAAEVDEINRYAEKQAQRLYEARANNRNADPSPLEDAYKHVAEVTNGMLNTISDVKAANLAAHNRIGLKDAKFDATKRSSHKMIPILAGGEAAQLAQQMTHNPWMAAGVGVPTAALTYAASSPAGMSRLAFAANDPFVQQLLAATPRMAAAAAQNFTRKRP